MTELPYRLYFGSAACAFVLAFGLTPVVRSIAIRLGLFDPPQGLKTHEAPTPPLGGVAIWVAFAVTLVLARLVTDFPTGTLHSLRGILAGGGLLFLLGLADDVKKPQGLGVVTKFGVQLAAAVLLIVFGLRIRFLEPDYVAALVTVVWVVGVANALNLVDIMDGLASSQAAIAAAGFLLIAMPSEEIHVNFAAAALFGACLGFLPWNLSSTRKIFMGDGGALSIGFVLAAISLGTRYSDVTPLGVYAPLFILGVPIYDTVFVMGLRMGRGQNPFKGSKDHFAIRLELMGLSRRRVVAVAAAASACLSGAAWLVTHLSTPAALGIYTVVGGVLFWVSLALAQVDIAGPSPSVPSSPAGRPRVPSPPPGERAG